MTSTSSCTIACSLCPAKAGSEDELQLHYLTSCPGYDVSAACRTATPTASTRANIPPRDHHPSRSQVAPAQHAFSHPPQPAQPPGRKQYCSVKFMWQPLTEVTHPKVTLLAAFESGGIDCYPRGRYYESTYIAAEMGTYGGQLVMGNSYVHPVKDFTIEKDGVVFLELEICASEAPHHAPHLEHIFGSSKPDHCSTSSDNRALMSRAGGAQAQVGDEMLARQKAEQELKEYKDRVAALEHQMEEYVSAMKDQTSQQAEYVEALNSLRKKADKLTEENIRLQQLNVTLSSEVEGCRSQIKHLLLEKSNRPTESFQYDHQGGRYVEREETRVKLEGELGLLREERAATLQELSQLREMVKHQRQQLESQEAQLQPYHQERDMSRQQVEELQKQLGQRTLASQQRHSEVQSYVVDRLQAESEYHKRWETEGEVASKANTKGVPSLHHNQSDTRRAFADYLVPRDVPGSIGPLGPRDAPGSIGPLAPRDVPGSIGPLAPRDVPGSIGPAPTGKPIPASRRGSANVGGSDAGKTPARSRSSTSSELFSAQVNTRNGLKTMLLCKLTNPSEAMKVVAMRAGPGEYDAGTIQYVGRIEGCTEDYVGIELDLQKAPPGSKGDGTYKGKQYFKCPAGYGVYVPLAKVYIEQQH